MNRLPLMPLAMRLTRSASSMHPVKGMAEYEDDYRFARTFLAELGSDAEASK
jgi:hypothetical protein